MTNTDDPLIRDIPSIKENLETAKAAATFKQAMPFLRPFLKLLNVDVTKIENALAKVDDLSSLGDELAALPDSFNDLFSPQGWIIYDLMNVEIAKAAIKKAESGDMAGAEADLVNYYDVKTIRWKLRRMNTITAFRSRMPLAEKALKDYEEERFYACVLVILSLLDGLVNELHEKHRGFFADGIDLTAWDSISAHNRGLNALIKIFQKGRYKTSIEPITIPYRNGIMHGMDLGYDNKVVAAKTWAALFATSDWALKTEKGLLGKPPEKPNRTWKEIFQQIAENSKEKERLENWQPREIKLGIDVPVTGESNEFMEESPERKIVEFISYWRSSNYGYMAKCLHPLYGSTNVGEVRDVFESKKLQAFTITEVFDFAPAVSEIEIDLVFEEFGEEIKKSVRFRLLNTDEEGSSFTRGKPGTIWRVINWQVH